MSYAHGASAHNDRVLELANRLRADGVEAELDQYEQSPAKGWPNWMLDRIEAAKYVLVICTETYYRRFRGKEKPKTGKGATWEGMLITQELYDRPGWNEKFIPVLFSAEDQAHIPEPLRGPTYYNPADGYEELYRRLTGQPLIEKPPVGEVKAMPPRESPALAARERVQEFYSVWTVPYRRNPNFTGRRGILDELKKGLESGAAAITQAQTIHGLGGVGKTEIAVEYAYERRADYKAVLWVLAETTEAMQASIAALVKPGALDLPEQEAREQPAQVEAAVRWLRENEGWLLVFDNVDREDAAEAVQKILPTVLRGHVLLTSRLSAWPSGFAKTLPVDTLPIGQATDFLMGRVEAEQSERPEAEKLARELGCLPLALEQAAAYMGRRNCGFEYYRERYGKLLGRAATGAEKSVATTWLVTMDQLGPLARAILRLSAFLAPDAIPIAMFEAGKEWVLEAAAAIAEQELIESDAVEGNESIDDALLQLADYSMIDLEEEVLSVHRLVQQVERGRMGENRAKTSVKRLIRMIRAYEPSEPPHDVRSWSVWDGLATHAQEIIGHAESVGCAEAALTLMIRMALYLEEKARFAEAERLYRRALEIGETVYGPEHPYVARELNNLAALLQVTGRLTEAEPFMRRALKIFETGLGPAHPSVATNLSNLAVLLQNMNRFAEAEPLARRALEIDEAAFGPDHTDVAKDLNNLAALLQYTKRLAEAEPLARRALKIDEAALGLEHPHVAIQLNNLAQLLQNTNRLAEAETLMRRALAIDDAAYGPDHPKVANRLNNLATLLKDTGRLAEAEPLMRRALEIAEASYDPGHPTTEIYRKNLERLLAEIKDKKR